MSGVIQLLKKGVVALSATLNKSAVSGFKSLSGVQTVTSDAVICTASGGTPGYTYLWAYVSGDTTINISTPTSTSTTFYTTGSGAFLRNAVYKCTVTDSVSGTAIATPTVAVQLENAP